MIIPTLIPPPGAVVTGASAAPKPVAQVGVTVAGHGFVAELLPRTTPLGWAERAATVVAVLAVFGCLIGLFHYAQSQHAQLEACEARDAGH